MNLYMSLLIFFFISLFSYAVFTVIKLSIKKKISKQRKVYLNKLFKKISVKTSSKEKIIDYDKLYHKILLEMWYQWTFWEILKLEPNEIWNINKIWELHKLRNKLVHDFDIIDDKVLNLAEKDYFKEVFFILK